MPNYRNEPVEFECELKNETDKAYLVVIDSDEVWIPKSLGTFTHDSFESVVGTIEVPTWFSEKEGLA